MAENYVGRRTQRSIDDSEGPRNQGGVCYGTSRIIATTSREVYSNRFKIALDYRLIHASNQKFADNSRVAK